MVHKSTINAGGGGGNPGSGIVIMFGLQWGTPTNFTIIMVSYAEYAFTINEFDNLQTSSGSINLTVDINGTPVTGLSGLTINSTPQSPVATANNVVNVGSAVTLVLSGNASAANLQGTLKATRN